MSCGSPSDRTRPSELRRMMDYQDLTLIGPHNVSQRPLSSKFGAENNASWSATYRISSYMKKKNYLRYMYCMFIVMYTYLNVNETTTGLR